MAGNYHNVSEMDGAYGKTDGTLSWEFNHSVLTRSKHQNDRDGVVSLSRALTPALREERKDEGTERSGA